ATRRPNQRQPRAVYRAFNAIRKYNGESMEQQIGATTTNDLELPYVVYVAFVGRHRGSDLFKIGVSTLGRRLGRRRSALRSKLNARELHVVRGFSTRGEALDFEKRLLAHHRSTSLQLVEHPNSEVIVFPATSEMRYWKRYAGSSGARTYRERLGNFMSAFAPQN